jgi:hypothetical protein
LPDSKLPPARVHDPRQALQSPLDDSVAFLRFGFFSHMSRSFPGLWALSFGLLRAKGYFSFLDYERKTDNQPTLLMDSQNK